MKYLLYMEWINKKFLLCNTGLGLGLWGLRPVSLSLSFSISTSFCFLSQDLRYFSGSRNLLGRYELPFRATVLMQPFQNVNIPILEIFYSIQFVPTQIKLYDFPFLPLPVFSSALPAIGIIVILVFLSLINLKCYFPVLANEFVPISTHLMAF